MSVNSFRTKKFEDFEILDSNSNTVGHVRVKPSGVLWSPKGARFWYGISINQFDALVQEHGKKQRK
jgi:hypothetical protein